LISANKEGIVSLLGELNLDSGRDTLVLTPTSLGYLAIQLLGLSVGTLVLPPSPSFYSRRQNALFGKEKKRRDSDASSTPSSRNKNFDLTAPRQLGKTASELTGYAILWWTFLGTTKLLSLGGSGRWGPQGGISRRMV